MALIKAKARVTTGLAHVSEGADVYIRALRDGSLVGVDWLQSLIMAGYGSYIDVGALTTPIVGGGNGTIVDLDQPEVNIGVPTGRTIVPVRIHIQCEVPADTDADVEEIIIGYDRLATNAGGTFTDEVIKNMRTDMVGSSLCDANSAYSGDQTVSPTVNEIARAGTVTNVLTSGITNKQFELLYEPKHPLFIVGPAQLICYWGGVAAMSGFAQVFWVEFPTTWLT